MKLRRKPIPKECCYCHKIFPAHESNIDRGEDKFCSRECCTAGRGYVEQIFNMLPSTAPELIEATGLPGTTVRDILRRLAARDRAHLTKLVRVFERGGKSYSPYAVQFKPGPKPIVSTLPQTIREAQNALAAHTVLGAMPGNVIELCDRTGLSRGSVQVILKTLRASHQCHVSGWKRIGKTGGLETYKVGNRADVPNPYTPYTTKERVARWFKKVKKDGRIGELRAKKVHNAEIRHRAKAGDPYINALFGTPAERLKAA